MRKHGRVWHFWLKVEGLAHGNLLVIIWFFFLRLFSRCKECCDGYFYPTYGLAPHGGITVYPKVIIYGAPALPKEQWPNNFTEDPESEGLGVYSCPKCGYGKPEARP
jgi:hypothetical protein